MSLRKFLRKRGYSEAEIKERMSYSPLYSKDRGMEQWIRSVEEILGREEKLSVPMTVRGHTNDRPPVVANHSGYGYKGSENFEHDDTGHIMNYSGAEDMMNDAAADHEGWEPGYDYD